MKKYEIAASIKADLQSTALLHVICYEPTTTTAIIIIIIIIIIMMMMIITMMIIIIIIIIIIQNILTGLNTHQCFKTLLSMGWYDRKLWLSDKMLKDYNYTVVKTKNIS